MLNPFLEKRLFALPVQPVFVEIDLARLNQTIGTLLGMKLKVTGQNPTFGFLALAPVSPEAIRAINSLPAVRMVHADQVHNIVQVPDDAAQWWPTSESRKVLEAESAFIEGYTGEMVKLGITDTGVDALHPQLQGAEFYSEIAWPAREVLDENGHGSHVASTAAGKLYTSPANMFVEGVSHARLVCVKCLGRGIGTGFTSEIVNAIATCYNKGAQIISMSLGSQDGEPQGGPDNDPEWRIIRGLTARGVIFVIAAGNSGPGADTIGNPGSCPEAITVAAIDKNGQPASFSSRGGSKFPTKPDVAAPGVKIYSGTSRISPMGVEQPQAGYGFVAISGTSMATPHISGFIALLKHKFPDMTAERFKEVMAAKGQSFNNVTGRGVPRWSMFS